MNDCGVCKSSPAYICLECKGSGRGPVGSCVMCNGHRFLCRSCQVKN